VLEVFEKTDSLAEKKMQFDDFWQRLDPAPVSEANERQLEYYRRVAFSIEHFGQYRHPWDDRGEAYIRYGDPVHFQKRRSFIDPKDFRLSGIGGNGPDAFIGANNAGAKVWFVKRVKFIWQIVFKGA